MPGIQDIINRSSGLSVAAFFAGGLMPLSSLSSTALGLLA